MLAGVAREKVKSMKWKAVVDLTCGLCLLAAISMLFVASYSYVLEFVSPGMAAIIVAGELSCMALVIWILYKLWNRQSDLN